VRERRDVTIKCPHCKSTDVERDGYRVSIDMAEPIYYTPYKCRACGKEFAVKSDDEHPVRAIIKAWNIGRYYPDDMELED
jgi:transposase-like protein